jgi:hypothetical protein
MSKELGRFGHHSNPAIDFCHECEILENEIANNRIGFTNGTPTVDELKPRISKALDFNVGGDLEAVGAKIALRRAVRAAGIR